MRGIVTDGRWTVGALGSQSVVTTSFCGRPFLMILPRSNERDAD
jgi:hypothetical protein